MGSVDGEMANSWEQLFVGVFQCYPPRFFWDKSIQGTCTVNPSKYFIGSVSSHLAMDIALMALPACTLWRYEDVSE